DYTGWSETRRARELVIFFYTAVGNYDYAISWIFHQDGTLALDAALTGIMLPKGVKQTVSDRHDDSQFGHLVAANVVAPHHQHFFNFRLDLDVDGTKNSAVELNTRTSAGGPDDLNGMTMEETVLASEHEAQRDLSMQSARKWAVVNPSVKNKLGHNSAYILVPGENSMPYASPHSSVRKRAGFINHHLWVTRYAPTEMSAAGPYPNQSEGGDGLPRWVSDDESIENQDIVLWYTMAL